MSTEANTLGPVGIVRPTAKSVLLVTTKRDVARFFALSADGADAVRHAQLAAEAFNVCSETGLTPRQLAEQRRELLAACRTLRNQLDSLARATTEQQTGPIDPRKSPAYAEAVAAIARAEGRTP